MEDKKFEITEEEAKTLCDFIEQNLIDTIRDDSEIDNMTWLVNFTDLFKRMADFCDYDGLTYKAGGFDG